MRETVAVESKDDAYLAGRGDELCELRHVGKLNTRVLWFFMNNRRIIAVHGIRNKGRAIPSRDLATARERMRDWWRRVQS